MPESIFLTDGDVSRLIKIEDAIESVSKGLKDYGLGLAVNLPRHKIALKDGIFRSMMSSIPALDVVGIKQGMWMSSEVMGKTNEVERRTELVTLYSLTQGRLLAVINSPSLNQLRTAGGSGVATEHLSRKDSTTLGVIGTGPHALAQLQAVGAVRRIKRSYVYSRKPENRENFVNKAQALVDFEVIAVDDASSAVKDSDIIVEATYSRSPVLKGEDVRAGTHVNSIGSSFGGKQVLPDSFYEKLGKYTIDFKEQAIYDGSGDILNPISKGYVTFDSITEIGEVVSGKKLGREDEDEITLYKSLGMGLFDIAVGKHAYDKAMKTESGMELPVLK